MALVAGGVPLATMPVRPRICTHPRDAALRRWQGSLPVPVVALAAGKKAGKKAGSKRIRPQGRAPKVEEAQTLRLTGGEHRSRAIKVPNVFLRPMMAKVRQALFSMLAGCDAFQEEARVLDLFAGSGIVGLESVSRGAGHVTFVDASPVCARAIEENRKSFGLDRGGVVCAKAENFLTSPAKFGEEKPFHLVTMTPPYEEVSYPELMALLSDSPALGEDSIVAVEYSSEVEENWARVHVMVLRSEGQLNFAPTRSRKRFSHSLRRTGARTGMWCQLCGAAVASASASLGLVYGALAAVLGLLLGAAAGAACGSFFALVSFGLSVPVCSFLSALGGLLLFGLLGAGGGTLLGACCGGACFFAGLPPKAAKPPFAQVAYTLALTAVAGPVCAAMGSFFGLLSGAFLGLAAGLLFAPFTFGLSVPLAGAVGAVLGAAVDAATGAFLAFCLAGALVRYRLRLLRGLHRALALMSSVAERLRLRLACWATHLAGAGEEALPAPCEERRRYTRRSRVRKVRRRAGNLHRT
ncbi:unnamed protein product [Effrenium voratum]|nr:unnamed protein product [Effrenium voratum]